MELHPGEKMTLNLKVNSKRSEPATPATVSSVTTKKSKRVKGTKDTEEFMELLHQVKQVEEIKDIRRRTTTTWKEWVLYHWNEGFLQALCVWTLWLFVGTMYYSNVDFNGNYWKGFYYSVSVGYCVGWGVLSPAHKWTKVFSILYLFVGALFVLNYVRRLIEIAVSDHQNAYEQLKIKKSIERTTQFTGLAGKVYVYVAMHSEKLLVIWLWLIIIFFGAFFSVATVHWPMLDGFYFAITSIATAGIFGLPHDSPNFVFLVCGLFTAVGVPTMAFAVSNIGRLINEAKNEARVETIINQELQITRDEITDILKLKEHNRRIMQSSRSAGSLASGIVSADGSRPASPPPAADGSDGIDKNEFLILTLIREKIIDIEMVHDVLAKFDRVDANHDGVVTLSMVRQYSKVAAEEKAVAAAAAAAAMEEQQQQQSGRRPSVAVARSGSVSSPAAGVEMTSVVRDDSTNPILAAVAAEGKTETSDSRAEAVEVSSPSSGITKGDYVFLEDV